MWQKSRRTRERITLLLSRVITPSFPDPRRLILWIPVALGVGAAIYFSLPSEPGAITIWAILCFSGVNLALAIGFRSRAIVLFASILLLAMASGFLLGKVRSNSFPQIVWSSSERAVELSGWIERIERSGGRYRSVIRLTSLENTTVLPKRVRIRMSLEGLSPGDAISIRAVLNRPPGPVLPGAYDPSRAAYFDGIGLTGYAISQPLLIDQQGKSWQRGFARMRWQLAERIRAQMPEREGGLAAALLTGDRSGVQPDDAEALRRSGLGHILAISGLHMALMAGSIYGLMRFVFASWPSYSRAHDPRKPAAFIALLAALAYLILSGASVPTQRAFIMAAVVLTGVIVDRRAFSFRSLAIAALIILCIAPESIIEPGFQMSFSAVAALIAVYEYLQTKRTTLPVTRSFLRSVWRGFAGLSITSLVAGTATAVFAGFHFQRIASFGLIANLLAMPVFSFWVMPAGVAALFLMMFGLEGPMLWIMGQGLGVVLMIAHQIGDLEFSTRSLTAPPGLVLILFGAGFVAMTIGRDSLKPAGAFVSFLGLVSWMIYQPPSMLITDGGVAVAAFEGQEPGSLSVSTSRRDRFDQRVFLQRIGMEGLSLDAAHMKCDTLGCTARLQEGPLIALSQSPDSLEDDCVRAGLIIFDGIVSHSARADCPIPILDNSDRDRHGGITLWLEDGQITTHRSSNDAQRPWSSYP